MREFVVSLLLMTSATVALAEVTHDPKECPFLTGHYSFKDPIFDPIDMTVVSGVNNLGDATLLVTDDESGHRSFAILDGRRRSLSMTKATLAVCSGGTIYIYEYENGKIMVTNELSLSSRRDLVVIVREADRAPITTIGTRT